MADPILDEVQLLLDKEIGDKKILEQILRAAQNDEVISNFERNYVRKLAEKHLGKQPTSEKIQIEPQPALSTSQPLLQKPIQSFHTLSEPKNSKSSSKNNKILVGVVAVALIAIIIIATSLSGPSELSPAIKPEPKPKVTASGSFSIKTDQTSFSKGDIISITGSSKIAFGQQVILSIENTDGEVVWSDEINVKRDGQFSTLTFAGGEGWEKSGTFTIIAESTSEKTTNTFSFRN